MSNLENLDLGNCINLEEVHQSLGCRTKLKRLNLIYCRRLKWFPYVNVESLEYLDLKFCSRLEKFPEICGRPRPNLNIKMCDSEIRELPSYIVQCLTLRHLDNLEALPRSIGMLTGLVTLDVSNCYKLESLPEDLGDLVNLEKLDATGTLISRPPSSIFRLNKLTFMSFAKQRYNISLKEGVYFEFPQVNEGLHSLEDLDLCYCNLKDGGLPEDIGSLYSLEHLNLQGNNFDHLPQSIAQLGALRSLNLSNCKRLTQLPDFMGMPNLMTLNLSIINIERLPRSIEQLSALRSLDLSYCERLKELPIFMGMQNLETLNLSNCINLEEVHRSLGLLKKLCTLKMTNCKQLKRFPALCIDSLDYLCLRDCSSLEKIPEILGNMKAELEIHMLDSVIRDLGFRGFENLATLPSSICKLKSLVSLNVSDCSKLKSFPEEIGDLENLENLDARGTLISQPPSSIVQLKKLKFLSFAKQNSGGGLVDGVYFSFPVVSDGLRLLENLNLSYCNVIDVGLPEDIGFLSSLNELYLSGNNFEHLPQSIAQLGALRSLDLSDCKRLKELPGFEGMQNLATLNLSNCMNLEEVHHSLKCLENLCTLKLTNCKRLKRFPVLCINSLEYLNLEGCSSLEMFPEILGSMDLKLKSGLKCLDLRGLENLVTLPSSICKLKNLVELNVSACSKLESLPEEIGDLENLEWLDAKNTLILQPPPSIVCLNKLHFLRFAKQKSEVGLKAGVFFVFPAVSDGLRLLENLNLSYCNVIDVGLPEDIGFLSSLNELYLSGNNFEHLPRSIAQLGALRSLDLSDCKRLKELPGFEGMQNLATLNLSNCIILEEVHHSLGRLKKLCTLKLTNCKKLKRLPVLCIDSLEYLNLEGCSSLENFPEILGSMNVKSDIHMLDSVMRDLNSMYISLPRSLSQDIVSLPNDISASDSLSQRVFTIVHDENKIPSWFHHQGKDESVSINLPENWYVLDNFLGLVVCYSGNLVDTTVDLIPLCDDGMTRN
uniref:Bacterial spot disease resistance protein 4 n=1 Tax=Solanum tuberosum TaxID=4113 RepID=M1BA12_SOLTU